MFYSNCGKELKNRQIFATPNNIQVNRVTYHNAYVSSFLFCFILMVRKSQQQHFYMKLQKCDLR